jgi:hypothetical protein
VAQQHDPATEEPQALFDVTVTIPSNTKLEDIERRLDVAGVPPDRAAALIKALRSVPTVKIGAGVTRERADRAKAQFSQAGLRVEVESVLSINPVLASASDRYHCPSCEKRVVLPENRQCPSCGVFVDKVTDDVLLKRKLMQKERSMLESQADRNLRDAERRTRESLEAALREQVRKELEKEYGLDKRRSFKATALRLAGMAGLLAMAFVGGNALSSSSVSGLLSRFSGGGAAQSAKGGAPADVDKMLDTIGPKGGGAGAAAGGAGDADLDDPLIQAAGGKRVGAKGLSVEQAVAASQKLSKSVGNTTGQNGGGPAAGAAAGETTAGPGAAAAAADAPAAAVPRQAKLLLVADFARQLAELGQSSRAREVLKALKSSPDLAAEAAVASTARTAEIEVQAWALHKLSDGAARQAAEALKAAAGNLQDPVERSQALGQAGAILARHPQLPPEAARAFLALAAEALKTIPDAPARVAAQGDWAVALGETLLAETTVHARNGAWNKARAGATQMDALIQQAPDVSSQARLYAVDHQLRSRLGDNDKATQSLQQALAAAERVGKPVERASLLRGIALLSQAASTPQLQAVVTGLQAQLQAAPAAERARGMMMLSLLHADGGMAVKAEQFRVLAQSTPGSSAADTAAVNANLIVQGDLAMARVLHQGGQFAEAETLLQRVGGYLL